MNKPNYSTLSSFFVTLITGLAILAASALVTPSTAHAADTAANATIRNVVKISYKDSAGNGPVGGYIASASATATVLLKAAKPTVGASNPASGQSVTAGTVQQYSFPIYSNANGSDAYTVDVKSGTTGDTAGMTAVNRYIISSTNAQGTVTPTGNTTTFAFAPTIGASIILADNNGDTVTVPFGSLNGISNNDFVIINATTYKVRTTNPGVTGSYDSANHALVAETPATIQLWLADGVTPADFSGVNLTGATISQRYLVTIGVTGAPPSATGDVYVNIEFYPTSDNALKDTKADTKTTFTAPTVTIAKAVAPLTGKPGDFLEYTITVTGGSADVTKVTVTDAVPIFTKLVSYTPAYVGAVGGDAVYDATHIFATITKGATTVQITGTAGDNGAEGSGAGFGKAPASAAGQPLTFYLGAGSLNNDGGTVASAEVYVIKYTVQILN